MQTLIKTLLLLCLVLGLSLGRGASAQEPITVVPSREDKEQDKSPAKLKAGLEKRIDIAFKETPLTEVVAYLQEESGVSFRINRHGLRTEGLLDDVPISIKLKQVRLKTGLGLMLDQLRLTWVDSDNRIMITSSSDAEVDREVRHHYVLDLAKEEEHQEPDYDSLIELMLITIEPQAWGELGGPAPVYIVDGGIVFEQTDYIHEEVAALFDTLRIVKKLPNDKYDVTPLGIMGTDPTDHSIQEKLSKPIEEVNFKEAPLHEVMSFLSETIDLNIYINKFSLEIIGLNASLKVSGQWINTSAKIILQDLLTEHDLGYMMYDDVVMIATQEEIERDLSTKVYPVRDFIEQDTADHELLRWSAGHYGWWYDYDHLIEAITNIELESWEGLGGPGSCSASEIADCLVISQTDEVHQKIEKVLTRIRQKRKGQPIDKPWLVDADQPFVHAYTLEGMYSRRITPTGTELQKSLEELKVLITSEVEPESWKDQENTIKVIGDRLIIKQVRANHLKIYRFLEDLGFLYATQRPNREFGGEPPLMDMSEPKNEAGEVEESDPPMQGGFF